MRSLKVLFIVPHLREAASNRYRVYQYLPYLQSQGIEATVRPFVDSSKYYRLLYQPGRIGYKTAYTIRSIFRRVTDLLRVGDFDVIFIQREAMPLGPAWFERLVSVNKLPIIFDFDDAIYLPNVSDANRWILWLKRPSKTAAIIRLSSQVIVGNEVLRRYAVQFNANVTVIPTPIDTDFYTIRSEAVRSHKPITIGWVGSNSTVQYLHQLDGVFTELASRYSFQVRVIGGQYDLAGVGVSCQPWSLENELTDLHSFDVGVMPMPDNDWTRGKCGFKALQYMGVGVPAVVSPVGVNRQIINHGENGFLASTEDEWITCLTRLIEDSSLRCRLGRAGRKTVEERYSVKFNAPRLLEIIHSAAATPK